jgi:hypothetical protein
MRKIVNQLFFSTIILNIIIRVYNAECEKITCSANQSGDTCVMPNSSGYSINTCQSTQFCPFGARVKDGESKQCKNKMAVIKQYPGGDCTSSSDCFGGSKASCSNGICTISLINNQCEDHSECPFGKVCRLAYSSSAKKTCEEPRNEGDKCESDEECLLTHGCLFNKSYNEKRCTAYFSLSDGEEEPEKAGTYSFCKSGGAYMGKCISIKINQPGHTKECTNGSECVYTNMAGGQITIPEFCECGYNSGGLKYCKYGYGDSLYQTYIKNTKEYLKSAQKFCNTGERNGICNRDRKSREKLPKDYQYQINNTTNSIITSKNYHLLYKVDDCVIPTVFPDYVPDRDQPIPIPGVDIDMIDLEKQYSQCPVYVCTKDKSQKTCAIINKGKDPWSVSLKDGVCDKKKKEICNIPLLFNEQNSIDAKCTEKKIVPGSSVRYPGEDCDSSTSCYKASHAKNSKVGTCESGKCVGAKINEACYETQECVKGSYCEFQGSGNSNGKCKAQKSSGSCKNSYECVNSMLCDKGQCSSSYHSYSSSDDLKKISDGVIDPGYYCKNGEAINGKCQSLSHTDTTNSDGMVLCQINQMCNYTLPGTGETVKKSCVCGYNKKGQGYCPIEYNKSNYIYLTFK